MRFDSRGATLGLTVLGGLVAAIVLGQAVAYGEFEKVAGIIAAVFGATLVLALGRRYWYAIPVSLALQLPTFQMGARNIDLGELSIAVCSLVFITRLAFKRERFLVFTPLNAVFLCYIGWVTLVYCLHPIGLAGFGSEMGGGRFYLQLYLALASLIITSSQDITEDDIKWLFGLIVLGTFLSLGRTLFEYFVLGHQLGVAGVDLETIGYYTWHQELAGPALMVVMLMFSYWAPSQIFALSHPWRGLLYVLCIPVVLLSGKRGAVIPLFGAPMVSAILHKESRYVALFGIVVAIGLSTVIIGQGNFFDLPLTAQRALSWLPADWDPGLKYLGGNDDFRAALREIAWEKIQANPWISDGFSVNIQEASGQFAMTQMMGAQDIRDQVMIYALGKAWHNTWLGYAADFGIPLSVIQAFVFLVVIVTSYRVYRATKENKWFHMLAAYAFMLSLRDVVLSHTSGHSAMDAFSRWWLYGMVFALARQFLYDKKRRSETSNETGRIRAVS